MGGYGMTPNVIAQISMSSRFLGLVGSLTPSEQIQWFPNQSVQDPDTWTLPHLIQLKEEYKKLQDHYSCYIRIVCGSGPISSPDWYNPFVTPYRPSYGYFTHSGASSDGRIATGFATVSTNLVSSNHNVLAILKVTIEPCQQDLNPRPCADNDQSSVWPHEMMVIEPGDKSFRMLTSKPTAFLSHIMGHPHHRIGSPYPWPTRYYHYGKTWLCSSLGVPLPALEAHPQQCFCRHFQYDRTGDHRGACRLVRPNLQHSRHTTGLLTDLVGS